jgi:uncharacterized protein YjbJ (UPF0337 family)/anti-anti-sigma regulatory factor
MTEAESGTAPDVGAAARRVVRQPVANVESAAPVRCAGVLFCDVDVRPPIAEIRMSGVLTEQTVADLGAELAALIRTGHKHLVVDGHGLSHVSPVCVGVLNRAAIALRPIGGELILTGLGNADAHRLRSAGLHDAIQLGVDADRWLTSPGDPGRPHSASNRQSADTSAQRSPNRRRHTMSATDKAKDKAQEIAGEIKEKAGQATDDEELEARGKADQTKGNLKQAGEKIKDAFKD